MPVRPSMQYIITFVRDLINDPAGSGQHYTDQQIQDRLDLQRLDLYREPLRAADTTTNTGSIEWHDFFSDFGFWETDYTIQSLNGATLTPDESDPLVGKWHFDAHQTQPVIINGKVYNIYGVASGLLTSQVAEERKKITSWTADGTTIQRLNNMKSLVDLADMYAARAWGWGRGKFTQVKLVRRDLKN